MSVDKDMPFLSHMEELRWHIIRAFVVILIFMIASFIAGPWIFQHIIFAPSRVDFITFKYMCVLGEFLHIKERLCLKIVPFIIQSRLMTGQFTMHLMSSLVIGIIVAFPYVFWEIWSFIRPGMHAKEQRYSNWAVVVVSFLFLIGIAFGYFVMSPLAIWFLSSYSISDIIVNEFDITSYVSTLVALVFGSGLLFQLPVVVYFLTKVGLVTPRLMRQYRKYALVCILILGAIITPPDPLSQSLIAIPLYILYEVSILISVSVAREKVSKTNTSDT